MCLQQVYTDILNSNLGESGYREVPGTDIVRFQAEFNSFPFAFLYRRTNSPKKLTPEERLRRYIEFKYGKLNVKVEKKNKVEKKP